LVQPLFGPTLALEQTDDLAEELTDRESQVLQLLGQGFPNKQIALQLAMSEHTAKFHVSAIYAKLGVTNRTEAVRRGVRLGLIVL
jgi:DNA-binding NarL/FixJ family response regulator